MLSLRNPRYPELTPIETQALADTGAVHLCVPEHVALQLRLEEYDRKEVVIADGPRRVAPYMGPLEVRCKNRVALGGALVFGDQVLLGAIPMEDMDLVVVPRSRRVDVNPESPHIAVSIARNAVRSSDDVEEIAEALRRDAEMDADPSIGCSLEQLDRNIDSLLHRRGLLPESNSAEE